MTRLHDRGYERTDPVLIEIAAANQSRHAGLTTVRAVSGEVFALPSKLQGKDGQVIPLVPGTKLDQSDAFKAMRDARMKAHRLEQEKSLDKGLSRA